MSKGRGGEWSGLLFYPISSFIRHLGILIKDFSATYYYSSRYLYMVSKIFPLGTCIPVLGTSICFA